MSVLDRILTDTRALVAARRKATPVSELEQRPQFSAPTRPFAAALRRADGPAYIAECKKASPSAGLLRPDYDAVALARGYAAAGADALSVLTEPTHFQGSLDDLAAVRAAVDVPLLRKDFVVGTYQLTEARAYGADAVLLIAGALEPLHLHDLIDAARALGLAALVEVHSADELEQLDLDRVRLMGVNHRDLATFTIDLDRSAQIFPALPAHVVRVAESGLDSAAAVARVREAAGADAVLIGTALMREPNPGAALAALRRDTAALLDKQPAT